MCLPQNVSPRREIPNYEVTLSSQVENCPFPASPWKLAFYQSLRRCTLQRRRVADSNIEITAE